MKTRGAPLVAALVASAAGGRLEAGEPARTYSAVVLMPFEGPPSNDDVDTSAVRGAVELRLRELGRFRVFASEELSAFADLSDEARKVGCQENSACLAEVTRSIGAELALFGELTVDDDDRVRLGLRLLEAAGARIVARAQAEADDGDALEDEVPALVDRLLDGVAGRGDALLLPAGAIGNNPSFAVMDLKAPGIPATAAEGLTDALVVEFSQFEGARVFSRKDMAAMLTLATQQQAAGCDDISCMAEIGGALGARFIVAGSVSLLQETWFVNVRVIDVQRAQVAASASESFRGPADELLVGMRFLVRRLCGVPWEGKGRARVGVNEEEAAVHLDDAAIGSTPALALPEALAAGKHTLRAEKDGYFPAVRDFYVEPARVSTVDLTLRKRPAPWYRAWWFWSAAAVVLAGATTTAVVVGKKAPPEPTAPAEARFGVQP